MVRAGALTFSLVLEPRRVGLPIESFPQVALAAGLAVCEVIEQSLPRAVVGLKWPNDVFLSGKKVSGILLESPLSGSARLIAGIGLNVNNSLAAAPAELQRTAISMIDVAGEPLDRTEVLMLLLERLDLWLRGAGAQRARGLRALASLLHADGQASQPAAPARATWWDFAGESTTADAC